MKKIWGNLDGVEIMLSFMLGCIGIALLTICAGVLVAGLR